MLASIGVDLKGFEDGLQKAETMAEQFSQTVGRTMVTGPAEGLKNLSRMTQEELTAMSAAVARNTAATKEAAAAKMANSSQIKAALNQELQITNELIKRQEAYIATLKAGTAQMVEASTELTEMRVRAAGLNAELEKIGSISTVALGALIAGLGAVVVAITKAVHTTAEFGLEMEHLSNRMGMTVEQATAIIGIFERFGVNGNIAARAMQMLATQVKQTQDSLDPFATRLGKVLGTLRDTNGQALNMSQVLDLVREKIAGAATASERLQIATQLLGARIGGQLVNALNLSNEEWEKQKESVLASLGPMKEASEQALAYKQATAALEQAFKGLELEVGTKILPYLTELVNSFSALIKMTRDSKVLGDFFSNALGPLGDLDKGMKAVIYSFMWWGEKLGQYEKGTAEAFMNMGKSVQAALAQAGEAEEKMTEEQKALNDEISKTEQHERQIAQMVRERVSLAEKARSLGIADANQAAIEQAAQEAITRLTEQRVVLEKQLADVRKSGTPLQIERAQEELAKNRVENAQIQTQMMESNFKNEELHLKAMGQWNLSNEADLLQKKLADERVVGDERLKLEADLYQKKKQLEEESVKYARQLGMMSVDQEISYRKQKAAELLGKGDVFGASQELVKARDMAIKQADQVMELTKKLRIVSLQDEMEYQRQKLQVVKGNAEEEMKILNQIADLDKQLYDRRLQFALTYTQKTIDAYREMQKVTGQLPSDVSKPGEEMTFERAGVEAERARFRQARDLEYIAAHGGTEEARGTAVKQAQDLMKQFEEMQVLGKEASEGMKEAVSAARDVLRAAGGGEEVRAPGGPSPLVGSLLSPTEGLATSTLARGTDIPRLDTSFADIAIRIRDVLLGAIPNIQNFSNQLATATRQIASYTLAPNNPGIVGPGGAFTLNPTQGSPPYSTGSTTPAPPTAGPGTQPPSPSVSIGVGSFGASSATHFDTKFDAIVQALKDLPASVTLALQSPNAANNPQATADALNNVLKNRQIQVQVGIDPNTGNLIVQQMIEQLLQ